MNLTKEDGRSIVYEEHPDWKAVEEEEIVDNDRWTISCGCIFKHIPTGDHYQFYWRIGATEQQGEEPYEYDAPEPYKVVQKEIIIMQWVPESQNEM